MIKQLVTVLLLSLSTQLLPAVATVKLSARDLAVVAASNKKTKLRDHVLTFDYHGMENHIAEGGNVNALDSGGNSALHLACKNQDPVAVYILMHNGARSGILNPSMRSPFYWSQADHWPSDEDGTICTRYFLHAHGERRATGFDAIKLLYNANELYKLLHSYLGKNPLKVIDGYLNAGNLEYLLSQPDMVKPEFVRLYGDELIKNAPRQLAYRTNILNTQTRSVNSLLWIGRPEVALEHISKAAGNLSNHTFIPALMTAGARPTVEQAQTIVANGVQTWMSKPDHIAKPCIKLFIESGLDDKVVRNIPASDQIKKELNELANQGLVRRTIRETNLQTQCAAIHEGLQQHNQNGFKDPATIINGYVDMPFTLEDPKPLTVATASAQPQVSWFRSLINGIICKRPNKS